MREIVRTSQFKRDVKKMLRRGKDQDKLKRVLRHLIDGRILPAKYKDHPLRGDYRDCHDCHIEPDWVLIYRIRDRELHLIRTGSHSDLFR